MTKYPARGKKILGFLSILQIFPEDPLCYDIGYWACLDWAHLFYPGSALYFRKETFKLFGTMHLHIYSTSIFSPFPLPFFPLACLLSEWTVSSSHVVCTVLWRPWFWLMPFRASTVTSKLQLPNTWTTSPCCSLWMSELKLATLYGVKITISQTDFQVLQWSNFYITNGSYCLKSSEVATSAFVPTSLRKYLFFLFVGLVWF